MRKKLPTDIKRSSIIGIKVQQETKDQIAYIAGREGTKVSSVINQMLVDYIANYFKIAKINWETLPVDEKYPKVKDGE